MARAGRPKNNKPRIRKRSGKPIKPVVAGQLEIMQYEKLQAIIARNAHLTPSIILRAALDKLLATEDTNPTDWSQVK